MESYTLEKTGLTLAEGRLVKRDKKGAVEASFEVRRISRAYIESDFDGVGIVITVGVLALAFVFYRFMPEGIWRWLAVAVSGVVFLACTLGIRRRLVVIEAGRDTLKYASTDLPERTQSFVAMINQAAEAEESDKAPEPAPGSVTPRADA